VAIVGLHVGLSVGESVDEAGISAVSQNKQPIKFIMYDNQIFLLNISALNLIFLHLNNCDALTQSTYPLDMSTWFSFLKAEVDERKETEAELGVRE